MTSDDLVVQVESRGVRIDVHAARELGPIVADLLAAMAAPDLERPSAAVFAVRRSEDDAQWQVVRDGDLLMGCEQPSEALHGLVVFIGQFVVDARQDLVSVHAAGVVGAGGATLLPGSSGTGKTTLCARLLQRGAGYLSDDSVALDQRGDVLGYARPLGFKVAYPTPSHLTDLADLAAVATDPGQIVWHVPPARLGATVERAAQPALVAFPRFVPDAPVHIEPVPPHVAARHLTVHVQNLGTVGAAAALGRIGTLVTATPAVEVSYGDAPAAADALLQLPRDGGTGERPPELVRHSGVAALCLDEGAVLVREETGEVLTVDAMGAWVWPLLDGSRSVDAIATELATEFDAPAERIHADVEAWIAELAAQGFLPARPGRRVWS